MNDVRVDPDTNGSDAALARYGTALRRQRLVYYAVLGAVVVAVLATVAVAWSRGEVANTTLHTVARAPANLTVGQPAASAQVAWRTGDRAATGEPQYRGTVVVYGRHTVRGVDARTGRQTWSYSRTNRTVCAALQTSGTTIAVYRLAGNCDEVTALASDTGRRDWTRTLDQDGQPVNGTPSFQITPTTFLVTTASVIYSIDPSSGYNRWTYARFGCSIHRAVAGSSDGVARVLISQTCTDPRCGVLKFCFRGPQLLLRDGSAGVDDESKNPTNFDHLLWNLRGNTDVPVSADGVLSALNTTTRTLDVFASSKGRSHGALTLSPVPAGSGPITVTGASDSELVFVRGVAAALDPEASLPVWTRAASAPATAVTITDGSDLTLDTARITVPTPTGAAVLDGASGRTAEQITLSPAPPADASIYPLGSGQLAAGRTGTVAYR